MWPNPDRAFDMFHYAASYFGDPDGQYNLARLYMTGQGANRDRRQAARWMKLAAEKGHAPARAAFGEMLLRGGEGVPRQPVLGLMWLAMAREGADPTREAWIIERRRGFRIRLGGRSFGGAGLGRASSSGELAQLVAPQN